MWKWNGDRLKVCRALQWGWYFGNRPCSIWRTMWAVNMIINIMLRIMDCEMWEYLFRFSDYALKRQSIQTRACDLVGLSKLIFCRKKTQKTKTKAHRSTHFMTHWCSDIMLMKYIRFFGGTVIENLASHHGPRSNALTMWDHSCEVFLFSQFPLTGPFKVFMFALSTKDNLPTQYSQWNDLKISCWIQGGWRRPTVLILALHFKYNAPNSHSLSARHWACGEWNNSLYPLLLDFV